MTPVPPSQDPPPDIPPPEAPPTGMPPAGVSPTGSAPSPRAAAWLRRLRAPRSVAGRIAGSVALVSLLGVLLAGLALTRLHGLGLQSGMDEALEDDLIHIAASLATDPDGRLHLTTPLETPLFDQPGSGWVWQVRRGDQALAQSRSLAPGARLDAPPGRKGDFVAPGGVAVRGEARVIALPPRPGTAAAGGPAEAARAVLHLGEPREALDAQTEDFAGLAAIAFGALGLGLTAAALVQVHLGLAPLRRLAADVARLRRGEGGPATDGWPQELQPLVDELTALQRHNDGLLESSRRQAADLAHALKTPLTVIQGVAEESPPAARRELATQVRRMTAALRRHVSRAAAGGARGRRAPVGPVVDDLFFALARILHDRGLTAENDVHGAVFHGASEDLEEMLGNLVENAAKWARGRIVVTAGPAPRGIAVTVCDDGPGIAPAARAEVLRRGARLDESIPGEGIGLAIVTEIAARNGGEIQLDVSELGGLAARLLLPGDAA